MKKALLIGVNINNDYFEESLKELKGLAKANNIKVEGFVVQNLKAINKKYYIGEGKINSIKLMANEHNVDLIIFNNELSPIQFKNLEDELNIPVLDRTMLILDIFASRAKTKEAKIQVEVARLKYLLPRLVNNNDNLSQQSGGNVNNRGSGEKQIDINKRIIRNKIAQLENELIDLEENKNNAKKKRIKSELPHVALVGYTNAGKSTLLNAFIEEYGDNISKEVLAKDMLFATLDTSIRHIKLPDNKEFLLSDTVGFISSLPKGLLRAFKSTLSEIADADVIINVCDVSSPDVLNHLLVTEEILREIGIKDIPIIYAFNKADKVGLATIKNEDNRIFLSAKNHLNLNLLINEIKKIIFADWKKCKMLIPYENSNVLSYLCEHATIIEKEFTNEGTKLFVELSPIDFKKYNEYIWIDTAS